jgi:hypothetical protein
MSLLDYLLVIRTVNEPLRAEGLQFFADRLPPLP